MSLVIVSGSAGLIGSETVRFFANKGLDVIGIDNDMRADFFGSEASTDWNRQLLEKEIPNYRHMNLDIRDETQMQNLFRDCASDLSGVIHCAAQPSHDWAARDPFKDFTVNANGTLVLLEMTRKYVPEAVFIFTSTNKVYGDLPNSLPLVEKETRWELENHS
ncbi:MAG: NAD-dependent epimerase/dehydratase family protein, partial [Proteobacteria bacterium]|nr:NAD-dependent epimerase/dehydratase family protein [Pseudomonadota bacterium]